MNRTTFLGRESTEMLFCERCFGTEMDTIQQLWTPLIPIHQVRKPDTVCFKDLYDCLSLGTDPGSCSLCAGCAGSPGPLWSGSCIPPGKLLCCWHSGPTSAECPRKETDTGCESTAPVGAACRSLNNKHLEQTMKEVGRRKEKQTLSLICCLIKYLSHCY